MFALTCFFRKRTGLTFLEVIITLTLYAVAFLGFFQLFNVALDASHRVNQEVIAANLARGLIVEIMLQPFVDLEDPGVTTLGPDAGEVGRGTFDDVDDYDGYSDGPPNTVAPVTIGGDLLDGSGVPPRPDFSDFTRIVDVYYCQDDGSGNIIATGNGGNDPPYDWKCVSVETVAPPLNAFSIVELKIQ